MVRLWLNKNLMWLSCWQCYLGDVPPVPALNDNLPKNLRGV